jgi:hypothetical protein
MSSDRPTRPTPDDSGDVPPRAAYASAAQWQIEVPRDQLIDWATAIDEATTGMLLGLQRGEIVSPKCPLIGYIGVLRCVLDEMGARGVPVPITPSERTAEGLKLDERGFPS